MDLQSGKALLGDEREASGRKGVPSGEQRAQSPEARMSAVCARGEFRTRLEWWAWSPVGGTSWAMRRTLEEGPAMSWDVAGDGSDQVPVLSWAQLLTTSPCLCGLTIPIVHGGKLRLREESTHTLAAYAHLPPAPPVPAYQPFPSLSL